MHHLSRLTIAIILLLAAFFMSIQLVFTELYFWIFNLDTHALSFLQGEIDEATLKKTNIQGFHFTAKEIAHFADVKSLLSTLGWVLPLPLCVVMIMLLNAPQAAEKISRLSLIIQGVFLASFAAIYVLGCWKAFTRFLHPLFFPQGNWQFHPQSLIIKLYPQEVMQTGMAIILSLTLLQVLALYFLIKRFNKTKHHVE